MIKALVVIAMIVLVSCSVINNKNPNNIKVGMEVTNGYCIGHVRSIYPALGHASLVMVRCRGFETVGGSSLDFDLDELRERTGSSEIEE